MSVSFRKALAVVERVAAEQGIDPAALLGRSRSTSVVRGRQLAMFALADELGMSSPEIGIVLGRDHTTVLYGLRKASASLGLARWRTPRRAA